jgi:hypothetical protein
MQKIDIDLIPDAHRIEQRAIQIEDGTFARIDTVRSCFAALLSHNSLFF